MEKLPRLSLFQGYVLHPKSLVLLALISAASCQKISDSPGPVSEVEKP